MENKFSVTFRSYSYVDKQACVDVFKSNIPTYFVAKELIDFQAWLDDQENRLVSDSEARQYIVVLLNDIVVGCGGFHINLVERSARMTWGMITNRLHRKGLGTQFLLHRISLIKSICPSSIIALDTTQHAAPFFETVGFRTTRITPDFYAPGMDRYDMVL
jgi:ribosomal-protein-alanine N-acetyltransferase